MDREVGDDACGRCHDVGDAGGVRPGTRVYVGGAGSKRGTVPAGRDMPNGQYGSL